MRKLISKLAPLLLITVAIGNTIIIDSAWDSWFAGALFAFSIQTAISEYV